VRAAAAAVVNAQDAAGRVIELADQSRRTAAEEAELARLQREFGDDDADRTEHKARMKGW
jgi:hypothetical protein